ncbi:MAG: type IV pilin [Nitrospiraceae bacterium]|nr:type IV pilin [Nitrospiraceae bacterium]
MSNRGTNPVIGVIFMVAFTILIATAVYIYVKNYLDEQEQEQYVEGWVVDAYQINTIYYSGNEYLVWNLSLSPNYQDINNSTSHLVLFPAQGYPAPPPEDVNLQLFYNEIEIGNTTYLDIYKVVSK